LVLALAKIMETQIRIWRVCPTNQIGTVAPTFFVETTEMDRSKAEASALKLAQAKTRLSNFSNWNLSLTRMNLRVDRFGRYIKHHQ
jgi:hypothetical protein